MYGQPTDINVTDRHIRMKVGSLRRLISKYLSIFSQHVLGGSSSSSSAIVSSPECVLPLFPSNLLMGVGISILLLNPLVVAIGGDKGFSKCACIFDIISSFAKTLRRRRLPLVDSDRRYTQVESVVRSSTEWRIPELRTDFMMGLTGKVVSITMSLTSSSVSVCWLRVFADGETERIRLVFVNVLLKGVKD